MASMANQERDLGDPQLDDQYSSDGEKDGLISGMKSSFERSEQKTKWTVKLFVAVLLASLGLNVFQLLSTTHQASTCISPNAKIPEREIESMQWYMSEYTSGDEDKQKALWDAIDYSEGFVAISHEETDAMGIPRSATFPWDANKGVYVVHGFHQLHCTTLLYTYTRAASQGKTPIGSYHHIEHCLDLLRQDIICQANDQLDWTSDHGVHRKTGEQMRSCSDWSKLEKFAREHTACYKTINITYGGQDYGIAHQLDRYTYCPPGSEYNAPAKAYREMVADGSSDPDWHALAAMSAETEEQQEAVMEAMQGMYKPNKGNLNWDAVALLTEEEKEQDRLFVNEHNNYVTTKDKIEPPEPF